MNPKTPARRLPGLPTNTKPLLGLLGAIVLTTGSLSADSPSSRAIRIQGSDTMILLNQHWIKEWGGGPLGLQVTATGGGSGLGIAALLEDETDIAAVSRPLQPEERKRIYEEDGAPPLEIEVALDGVSIFVHDSNPVGWLSIEQLRKIYTGEITNWKEVGGRNLSINLYSRNANSGTYAFFTERVLQDEPFHPRTSFQGGTEAVRSAVSRDPRGIGYGGIGYAQGIRLLRITDPASNVPIAPSNIQIITEMYPLSRPLYFVVRSTRWTPPVESFVGWVLGAEGQNVVVQQHYYPLPKSRRILPSRN